MTNNELKDEIQDKALNAFIDNGKRGTIVLVQGTGKSKLAINAIKKLNKIKVLYTCSLTAPLKAFEDELAKWEIDHLHDNKYQYLNDESDFVDLNIDVVSTQLVYKYSKKDLAKYDLIIVDEIHTVVSPEYSKFIVKAVELNIDILCLTGTPDDSNEFKRDFYEKYIPIVFKYLKSDEDGLINKKRIILFYYNLSDKHKVLAGNKAKPFWQGEAKYYEYLKKNYKKACFAMSEQNSENFFDDMSDWFFKGNGDDDQKKAARQFYMAMSKRKDFLLSLKSSVSAALYFKNLIYKKYPKARILLFSELTGQAIKLSNYSVHTKNPKKINEKNIKLFSNGTINELASCNKLALGMNFKNVEFAIIESFNSSVKISQKLGRLNRLEIDRLAKAIFIIPKGTQSEKWIENMITKGILDKKDCIVINQDVNKLYEML